MFDAEKLKLKIEAQNSKKVKIGEWFFILGAIGGYELIKAGIKSNGDNKDLYVDVLLKSIVGWEGVKVKDLYDAEDEKEAEELVPFNPYFFDVS